MRRAEKRRHLIKVAASLFNRFGYHAAGVDQVIAEAGIAKTTLYRHFPAKDDLIVAVLNHIDERFRRDMRAAVAKAASDGCGRLLATFDYLESWFSEDSFFGCPFVNAAGEYGDRDSPVFRAVESHKRRMKDYFGELAGEAGLVKPSRVGEEINLLHEGAIAVAHVTGDPRAAVTAKAIARRLLLDEPQAQE